MVEAEGVIKFDLDYEQRPIGEADISELNAWRSVLKSLELIGQIPNRYDGYGFGNVSQRTADGFVISGTQTGGIGTLESSDHAVCTSWDLTRNAVSAYGETRPSSESLSHASIYDVHEAAQCALHVHSPEIWQASDNLGIAVTDPSVPYGTPEMAVEVRRVTAGMQMPGIFSMGGHEDGVFTFGCSLVDAGLLMIRELIRARVGQ
jgi:hypothetical protein